MLGAFFQIKALQAPLLPKFHPNFPKKDDLQKKSALSFWVQFLWIQTTYNSFAKVFTHFAQISTDFALIFTKSKLLGVRLHPLHPRLLLH